MHSPVKWNRKSGNSSSSGTPDSEPEGRLSARRTAVRRVVAGPALAGFATRRLFESVCPTQLQCGVKPRLQACPLNPLDDRGSRQYTSSTPDLGTSRGLKPGIGRGRRAVSWLSRVLAADAATPVSGSHRRTYTSGEVPERSNGPVSKTGVPFMGTQGSNPCLSARKKQGCRRHGTGGTLVAEPGKAVRGGPDT